MMKVAGFSVLLTVMPLFPQPQPSGGNAPGCKPISDSVALQFEIEDSDSLKSDGKGPYRHNTDCIWAGISPLVTQCLVLFAQARLGC